MQMLVANGVGLHWRQDGDPNGAPVVFANSLGTDMRLWDDVVTRLPEGLRLIRYDKRGHGLSDAPDAPNTIDDLTDDVECLLSELDVNSCVFIGTSIGGMIGQNFAARRPDLIAGLFLTNTAAKMGTAEMWHDRIKQLEDHGIESIADGVLDRWFSAAFLARTEVGAWRNMLLRTSLHGYIGCCHAIAQADLIKSTAVLTLPVCVIAGSDDRASPPAIVKATADMISGSKFHVLDGVGHLPSIEAPDMVADKIMTFIKEIAYV